jgi:hypothetical protein
VLLQPKQEIAMNHFSNVKGSCSTDVGRPALRNTLKLAALFLLLFVATPGEASAAVSAEVRNACMNYYFRFCSYTGGNVARASACMRAHHRSLSKRCKAATSRSKKSTTRKRRR